MRRILLGAKLLGLFISPIVIFVPAIITPFIAWQLGGWMLLTPVILVDILVLSYLVGWLDEHV